MNITVRVIPHKEHRYETCGDWFFTPAGPNLIVLVSDMGNRRFELLVAQHEITEAILCYERGILEKDVTEFDKWHLAQGFVGEPGDHPDAPYRLEHCYATKLERDMAKEMGVNWEEYDEAISNL